MCKHFCLSNVYEFISNFGNIISLLQANPLEWASDYERRLQKLHSFWKQPNAPRLNSTDRFLQALSSTFCRKSFCFKTNPIHFHRNLECFWMIWQSNAYHRSSLIRWALRRTRESSLLWNYKSRLGRSCHHCKKSASFILGQHIERHWYFWS